MVPVVGRYGGRPVREIWRELETWKAKLLVLATYPLSLALIMFHALRVSRKETSRRIV